MEVRAGCALICCAIAAKFYANPHGFMQNWQNKALWQNTYKQGLQWHEVYVKSRMASLLSAMGMEAVHFSLEEVHSQAPSLLASHGDAFLPMSTLSSQRALICITDVCQSCGQPGPISLPTCGCGGQRPQGVPVSLPRCLEALSAHAQQMAAEPCGLILLVGQRSLSVFVNPPTLLVADSHYRTWTGKPAEASLVISGKWLAGADLTLLLGRAIGQGDLGYNQHSTLLIRYRPARTSRFDELMQFNKLAWQAC